MSATFTACLSAPTTPLKHAWEHTVGSGHALLALRADWQQQLQRCHHELGFRHVRFHGLLDDDMGTLIAHQDQPLYSFFNADRICDFLLSIGMRPFVELGFMPEMLASGHETVFHYRGNVTPPVDYNAWATLIGKLLGHWVERYGIAEVRQWYFEVWNEPNLPAFWTGTQDDYFKLYSHTVQAIKTVDASLRVDGHDRVDRRTARLQREEQLAGGLHQHAHLPDRPARFRGRGHRGTTRQQPARPSARPGASGPRSRAPGPSTSRNGTFPRIRETTFTTSRSPQPTPRKIALETDRFADGYSFWTFTDIFEENYFPSIPFHGGFGLLNLYGVPKPVYRAFQLLHALGHERLPVAGTHETVDAWVVHKGRSITVFLTNHVQPRHDIATQRVEVRLTHASAPLEATIERIDEDHANPRRCWQTMGEPEYLNRSQVEKLEAASRLMKQPFGFSYAERTIRFDVNLPPHAVAAVTLEFAPAPPGTGEEL